MTADTGPRWLDDGEQAAWRGLLEMHARLNAQLNRELQDSAGISVADFSVLVRLSEHADGRLRVLELARVLRWEKSRMSHQLTRMQHRGLIERDSCTEDRRGSFVRLTPLGRRTIEAAAPQHVESVRRYLIDRVDAGQLGMLREVCATVIAALEPVEAEVCCGGTDAEDSGPLVPGPSR